MTTFNEANQARLSLKMSLSHYAWFNGLSVQLEDGDYIIVVNINAQISDKIRKIVPIVHNGVGVKTYMEGHIV